MAKRLTQEEKDARAAKVAANMAKMNAETLKRFKAQGIKMVEIIGAVVSGPYAIESVRPCVGTECYAAVI
jgi:hypothetical protein